MPSNGTHRKLTAILAADVAGFSRLMERDEAGTHRLLAEYRQIIKALIAEEGGRTVGAAGDSLLADFPSVVDAVRSAVEIQRKLRERNDALPPDQRLRFRIGINLGDVIVDGADIFGDGVNIAARLQALAEPGGICISGSVYDQVRNKLGYGYRFHGSQTVKNIAEPVRVYSVSDDHADAATVRQIAPNSPRRLHGRAAAVAVAAILLVAALAAIWRPGLLPQEAGTASPDPAPPSIETAGKPTIAVLPFANQGNDPGEDYFSDGITEEIISALGRFSNLSVIARNAVLKYKSGSWRSEDIARELQARYIVEGSVRRAGDQVRVTASLTDASRGLHLWSDKFDGELKDVFALQDEVARRIVSMLAVRLTRLEQERTFAKPTESLAAYDYLLRGRQYLFSGDRTANLKARELFEQALEQDPRYAAAYADLGWAYYEAVASGWTEFVAETLDRAEALALNALSLDDRTVTAHGLLGFIHLHRKQYDLALAEAERALALNPSDPPGYLLRGSVLMWSGEADGAIEAMETARRLDPTLRFNSHGNLGFAYYLAGRYDDARHILEQGLVHDHARIAVLMSHTALAASYAQLGRTEEAAAARSMVLQLWPFFQVDDFVQQFREPADREHFAAGLRKAGL